jgi:16S rRNA (guanine527-N7)-methyltransferase
MADTADWERLARDARAFGVALTPEQITQLRDYLALLCEWNRRFNLTAVERPDEILAKHFLDSLTCASVVDFPRQRTLIDVGTGAGFPGVVLKIAYPHLRVTLLDAVQKKLRFIEHVAEALELEDVRTLHARAEDAARYGQKAVGSTQKAADQKAVGSRQKAENEPRRSSTPGTGDRGPGTGDRGPGTEREAYDVVTSRAVARLNVLAEWTLPFARVGGVVVAMKGPAVEDEVREARDALRLLGGGRAEVREFQLPGTEAGRSLVVIPKSASTPREYPRLPGAARKAPLGAAPAPKLAGADRR